MKKYHLWIPFLENMYPLAGYAGAFDTFEDVQKFIDDHIETEVNFWVCHTDENGRLVYHAKLEALRDDAIVMLPPDWTPHYG